MRRTLIGAEHPDVAVTLAELGRVYQDEGFHDRAAPLHIEALAIRTRALGEQHGETAVSQSDLASVLRLNGDLPGAERLLRQCLETNLKTRGATHPNTADDAARSRTHRCGPGRPCGRRIPPARRAGDPARGAGARVIRSWP